MATKVEKKKDVELTLDEVMTSSKDAEKAVKTGKESLDESLAILQPEDTFVTVNGEDVYVKPFTFGKLLKALKHLANLMDVAPKDGEIEQSLFQAFANHEEDVLGLLQLATGKDAQWFEELDAESGFDLAVLTYKVNESFFSKTLLPKLEKLFPSGAADDQTNKEQSKATGSTSSQS